jgi:hypothetical protein
MKISPLTEEGEVFSLFKEEEDFEGFSFQLSVFNSQLTSSFTV